MSGKHVCLNSSGVQPSITASFSKNVTYELSLAAKIRLVWKNAVDFPHCFLQCESLDIHTLQNPYFHK